MQNIEVGTPVYNHTYGKFGGVADVQEIEGGNVYVIGGGGMTQQNFRLSIAWEDGGFTTVSEGVAAPWIEKARQMGLERVLNAPEMLEAAKRQQAADVAQAARERQEAEARRAEFRDTIRAKIPADAKAVIVAELMADKSDSMTDYFASVGTRTVILGFSRHTRDLFPEMRKAAANFTETAHLADAPEDAENRQKWSMGGGYFLKIGGRHSDGWKVYKIPFHGDDKAACVPHGEWAVPDATTARPAAVDAAAPVTAGAFTIEAHTHTKKGFRMWIAVPGERVERETFDAQLATAKALGGWYSRKWGTTPAGFAFKDEAAAHEFVTGQAPAEVSGDNPAPAAPAAPAPGQGDKLRALADGMESAIAAKLAPRLENTPKRQRQAGSARQDGEQMRRAQTGLRALAEMHDAGTVPPELVNVTTKKRALDLAAERIDRSNAGYYDCGFPTGEPASDAPDALAFWALLKPRSAEETRAEAARQKLAEIKRSQIPGFFGTPEALAAEVVDLAAIEAGDSVLEPNAGAGALLDAVRAAQPGANVTAYEINGRLREYLELRGHAVAGWDFLDHAAAPEFDAVVMNPPFERGQDMAHVRHAFACLKPGGRLVAIMGPGFQYRQDRAASSFRDWLDTLDHSARELPAGTFKESGTGVASVLVTISKESE